MSFDGETYAGHRQHLVEFDPLRVRDVRDAGQDEEEHQGCDRRAGHLVSAELFSADLSEVFNGKWVFSKEAIL